MINAGQWRSRTLATIVAAFAVLGIAGCGGSAPLSDAQVAQCLANEIDFGSCQKATHVVNFSQLNTSRPAVNSTKATCTHRQGNEYVCDASNGSSYQITDDGTNVRYQQIP